MLISNGVDRRKISRILVYLIFFIFITHFVATKLYWYSAIWWLDMLVHFLGGFWLGLVFLYFFPLQDKSFRSICKIFLPVFFIGIGWEVFEILVNDVIAQNLFDVMDFTSDLFFDLAGGFCAILYILVPLEIKKFNIK